MENIKNLVSTLNISNLASTLDSEYNFSKYLNLDADAIRAHLYKLFNNQAFQFIDQMSKAEIYTPRWKTLRMDMIAELTSTDPLKKKHKIPEGRLVGIYGKWIHPHSKMIKDKDPRLFSSGILEAIPFLNQQTFEHNDDDLDYLKRVYAKSKIDKKEATKINYFEKCIDDGSNDFMADDAASAKVKLPDIPDEVLDGFPHNIGECFDDAEHIPGLTELMWMELGNMDLMYDFIKNSKDEYFDNIKKEIVAAISECKSDSSDENSKKNSNIVDIINKHVKSFRSGIKADDFTTLTGLVTGAFKQNGKMVEEHIPSLIAKLPDSLVGSIQEAYQSKTGLQLDRNNVALQLQDSMRDMRMKDIPLDQCVKKFTAQMQQQQQPQMMMQQQQPQMMMQPQMMTQQPMMQQQPQMMMQPQMMAQQPMMQQQPQMMMQPQMMTQQPMLQQQPQMMMQPQMMAQQPQMMMQQPNGQMMQQQQNLTADGMRQRNKTHL